MQEIGKKVIVFKFMEGLGNNSDLEYVPDMFIDLEERMSRYELPRQ